MPLYRDQPAAASLPAFVPLKAAPTHQGYDLIVKRFSKRVKALQFNCTIDGYFINGVTVKNPHSNGVRGIFPEKAVAAAKGVNPPNAMALAFQAAQTPKAPAATEAPAI